MRGLPTSRGTPASVHRLGSLPLRRRAAAPGKSTQPTPATCRPPALVCDCEYLITQPPVGQGDQRAWQEMTDGRGPPPKGKGHPRREDPGTRRPSAERQLGPTGGNRIRSSRGRPRRAATVVETLRRGPGPRPRGPSRNMLPRRLWVSLDLRLTGTARPIGKPRVNSAPGIAVKSAAQPRPGWTSPSPAADWYSESFVRFYLPARSVRVKTRKRGVLFFHGAARARGVPFFSAEPAVSAPWVLASFVDGIELVDPPLAPVVPGEPPVDGVRCVVSLLGVVAAGPPDVELPPADEPLLCATARELARVKAAASK